MYLKSIEVHGFKSFANKMVFDFHDGITAIVGPNGSGKSNVGDAVRWVLGEQSAKQLRGAKMEDVIFSGTEARRPLGFAYVAITLDNSDHKLPIDFEEVTVARRVFRSGESEYLINGANCRLRDVQELFLDTGIGKEGYSIIGQGQVERILSGKPEERRELFDEAAGIVKFKKRKQTAEKNLEDERANLCRINDILSEIEKQIVPLEKQSAVAKEYIKYREELKNMDVNMFLMEYDRIHNTEHDMTEKIRIATKDMENANKELEQAKSEYEKLQTEIESFNQSIEAENQNLSESKLKKEQLEGEIKVFKEQIAAIKQSDAQYKERKAAIDKDIEAKQQELQKINEDKANFDTRMNELKTSSKEVEARFAKIEEEIKQFSDQIETLNGDIFQVLSDNSNIKTQMQRYETMLEQDNLKKTSLNQRVLKCKSNETLEQEKLTNLKTELKEIDGKIKTYTDENASIEEELKEHIQRMNSERQRQNQITQEYHKQRSRLESLTNITERYEGYGNSIRKIMEQKKQYPGIHGVVADIIKVNKEYEVAVETALGGSIQNIVTDDENTAKSLIEFLKKNRFGRATFLPLTSITNKNTFYNDKALSEEGVIGFASTLVTTKEEYHGLVDYLLGRIVVVDHIDHAIALARKYHYSLRIVTIEGDVLNPGGSMSGGAYRNSSNLLGRRREMTELTSKIKEFEEELRKIASQLEQDKQESESKQGTLAANKKALQEIYLKQNTARINLSQAKANIKDINMEYEEIRTENKEIEEQITELNENISKLKAKLDQNTSASKEHEEEINAINARMEEKKNERAKVQEEISSARMNITTLDQKIGFFMENVTRVKQEIQKLTNEEDQIDQNLQSVDERIHEKEKDIADTIERIRSFEQAAGDKAELIRQITANRDEISGKHKTFFAKREQLTDHISQLDKEIYRLNGQSEKLEDQLNQQVSYMWDEYEITYTSALELKSEEEYTLSDMKKSIASMKQKIRSLGDVNVNAIEDYKNLKERYELLHTQHNDLVESEEALQKVIEELDAEMRKQFEEKFKEIRVEFDKVFKELFGGGKGSLQLVDNEDILEAGIRIIAQPPGKKLQNMMQMSGGEKSLTAICLLFAIQNLKPSPFCLLDEIEAALDDSNVSRYAEYLQKLSDHTQFIVITHRRGTMGCADRLYGITMQEKGISTLVSVNLIEGELEA